jgi:hypothetical protein
MGNAIENVFSILRETQKVGNCENFLDLLTWQSEELQEKF